MSQEIREHIVDSLSLEFDAVFDKFVDDLAAVKGWSLRSVFKIVQILLEAAPEMVPSWLTATPEERKTAIVKRVNEHVDIPVLAESAEEKLIGVVYDLVAVFL